jgi:hypothetical protein
MANPEFPIIDSAHPKNDAKDKETAGMNRRQLVRRLAMGAGAGMALPAIAAGLDGHPVHRHLADMTMLAQGDQNAAAANWTPEFLDPYQNETLIVLGERIVPNSTKALCNRFVDLLLSVDTREVQQKFINSLSAFDAYALGKYQQPFKDLSETQQVEILTFASTTPPGKPPAPEGRRRRFMTTPAPGAPQPEYPLTMRDHFENIKGWVSGAFYSSEIGMRELGWDGNVYFSSYPGCEHDGGHA